MAPELAYHGEIKKRWRDFEKLLDQLTKKHEINDRAGLGRAVDTAMCIYHGRSALHKDDVKQLLKFIPKVTEILSRPDNDLLIANIMIDRDRRLIKDLPYDPLLAGKTVVRTWQINADLSQLERVLRRPRRGRAPDVKLLGMLRSLERYWKTSTPSARKVKSKAKFLASVVQFIDPAAVKKLRSAVRHRLK